MNSLRTTFERNFTWVLGKVRELMGEAGNNRALRVSDLEARGLIGSRIGKGGTGGPATTDDLPEGKQNLYYSNQRAAAASPVRSVAGETGAISAEALSAAMRLGSAASANVGDFATPGQGQLAESAVQDPGSMPQGVPFVRMEKDWAALEPGYGLKLTAIEGDSETGGRVVLEVTATGGAVPYHIADNTAYRVPNGIQALFTLPIDLGDGASIELDGALVEVS